MHTSLYSSSILFDTIIYIIAYAQNTCFFGTTRVRLVVWIRASRITRTINARATGQAVVHGEPRPNHGVPGAPLFGKSAAEAGRRGNEAIW